MERADAFVLAAGFGTRLRPLTEHLPKPLVPVCGVPMLAYALAHCRAHGLTRAIVNAHHLADKLLPWAGVREGVQVDVVVEEPDILGTGGGLRAVRDRLADTFVVVNGDVLVDVDLAALRARVPAGGAAMALRPSEDAARYGVVAQDAEGVVVRLSSVASTAPHGDVRGDTHFTGVHAMDRATLQRVPDGFACIVRTAYRELVPARAVRGLRHGGVWLDVGDPAAYLDANRAVLHGDVSLALDPFPRAAFSRRASGEVHGDPDGAAIVGPCWVGHGASVSGATLARSIVGAGAQVSPGAILTDCVVWEGVDVPPGDHHRVVFHPGGALTVDAP